MHARLALVLIGLAAGTCAGGVTYSDALQQHYPVRGQAFRLDGLALESPAITWDTSRKGKITVVRTRGDQYPYEEQKCVITVEGGGLGPPRALSAAHFRTVQVTWITDKLILLRLGLGPAAAVEAIYDLEKDAWVYRESLQYDPVSPSDGGAALGDHGVRREPLAAGVGTSDLDVTRRISVAEVEWVRLEVEQPSLENEIQIRVHDPTPRNRLQETVSCDVYRVGHGGNEHKVRSVILNRVSASSDTYAGSFSTEHEFTHGTVARMVYQSAMRRLPLTTWYAVYFH